MAGSDPIHPGPGSRVLPTEEVTALMTSHNAPGYAYAGTRDGSVMKVLRRNCIRIHVIKCYSGITGTTVKFSYSTI